MLGKLFWFLGTCAPSETARSTAEAVLEYCSHDRWWEDRLCARLGSCGLFASRARSSTGVVVDPEREPEPTKSDATEQAASGGTTGNTNQEGASITGTRTTLNRAHEADDVATPSTARAAIPASNVGTKPRPSFGACKKDEVVDMDRKRKIIRDASLLLEGLSRIVGADENVLVSGAAEEKRRISNSSTTSNMVPAVEGGDSAASVTFSATFKSTSAETELHDSTATTPSPLPPLSTGDKFLPSNEITNYSQRAAKSFALAVARLLPSEGVVKRNQKIGLSIEPAGRVSVSFPSDGAGVSSTTTGQESDANIAGEESTGANTSAKNKPRPRKKKSVFNFPEQEEEVEPTSSIVHEHEKEIHIHQHRPTSSSSASPSSPEGGRRKEVTTPAGEGREFLTRKRLPVEQHFPIDEKHLKRITAAFARLRGIVTTACPGDEETAAAPTSSAAARRVWIADMIGGDGEDGDFREEQANRNIDEKKLSVTYPLACSI
ncbi:unnamed protein product [Amoebophrya sp. A120]|nr:unnamed protein product [Amoebophrya sp. A120]|eukprot:GSA120T00006979001.1